MERFITSLSAGTVHLEGGCQLANQPGIEKIKVTQADINKYGFNACQTCAKFMKNTPKKLEMAILAALKEHSRLVHSDTDFEEANETAQLAAVRSFLFYLEDQHGYILRRKPGAVTEDERKALTQEMADEAGLKPVCHCPPLADPETAMSCPMHGEQARVHYARDPFD